MLYDTFFHDTFGTLLSLVLRKEEKGGKGKTTMIKTLSLTVKEINERRVYVRI